MPDTLTTDRVANPARLTVEDLETFALAADRMQVSLACLIGALEDGEPILWMGDEGQGQG